MYAFQNTKTEFESKAKKQKFLREINIPSLVEQEKKSGGSGRGSAS
jgi:hypothetical protein